MAKYQIELEDGKIYEIETDDSKSIVKTEEPKTGITGKVSLSDYQSGKRNILGSIIDRPEAAMRAFATGKNPVEAFNNPTNIPSIQQEMLKKYWGALPVNQSNPITRAVHSVGGIPVSAVGLAADMATDPRTYLLGAAGKGIKAIGESVGIAKPAYEALGRFFTKPRSFLKFGKDAVLNIAKKGEAAIEKLDEVAGTTYENGIKQIKGYGETDNITSKIDELKSMYPDEKFTYLDRVKERFTSSNKLSAEELRNLKQEIKKSIPNAKSILSGKSEATPIQAKQLEVYNAVDDELVKLGGNKYIKMKAEYSDWKKTARDAYKAILEDGEAGDRNLRNWFGYGLSRRQTKALESINIKMPPKEQFMQDFYAWRRGQMAKGAVGAAIPAAYLIHRAMAEQVLPQR